MGGKNSYQKTLEKQQQDTNTAMLDIAKQQQAASSKALESREKLRDPLISQQLAFASGDAGQIRQAAAVPFAQFAEKSKADRASIKSGLTGAERDFALSEEDRNRTGGIRQFLSQLVTGAPTNLAQLGSEDGNLGQNQAGTSLSGYNSSVNATQNAIQMENQRRAQTLAFVGQLFGAAGSMVGGGLASGLFKKAAAPKAPTV